MKPSQAAIQSIDSSQIPPRGRTLLSKQCDTGHVEKHLASMNVETLKPGLEQVISENADLSMAK